MAEPRRWSLPGLPQSDGCLVMGVLNVTPDSFSDGGSWFDQGAAIEHGLALAAEGAAIVDVGGESTRPGATRVSADEEQRRVLPVVKALADAGVVISIDTMRASTAAAALGAGATLINDVSGGLADPELPRLVASLGVAYVVMHWRGHSDGMQQHTDYVDVVNDVVTELGRQIDAVVAAGVSPDQLIVDPGIGFAKQADHNWALLRNLDVLAALDRPVLVGVSRKSFLGALLARDNVQATTQARDIATSVVSGFVAAQGIWGVRVHDVAGSVDAISVAGMLSQ